MSLIKPPRLQPGDTVAIVSSSSTARERFPAVFDAGVAALRRFGLEVREFPTASMTGQGLYDNPQARAEDLNAAFADPDIKMIVPTIGGEESVRILPFLDPGLAVANPTIMLGFSDISVQSIFYRNHGLVTFNGLSVMAGLAQLGDADPVATQHVRSLLFDAEAVQFTSLGEWSNGYNDWADPANADKLGPKQAHEGWHWLQGNAPASSPLIGGCIEVLEYLKSTEYWPTPESFDDAVLFFETSEEKPSVDAVSRWLRNYGTQGVFDRCSALLFGRARDYSVEEKERLDQMIMRIVRDEFGANDLVIVTNLDFGHTDPQWVLPLGVPATVDPIGKRFLLQEPAVL